MAPFLPTTRAEMDELGWDSCDVVLVTGDAYVDHPSFGMALVGRLLESHGFRVGILDQPDWRSAEPFRALGRPNLMWGVTAGNMDSMVNRYTSDRKIRRDDAYSPDGAAGLRPDRSVLVYAQRCREAFADVPVVIGGIEASLRRIAHYDYWSDKVRRSVLVDSRGGPARLRQRRARDRRDRAPARGGHADRADPRPARHGVHRRPRDGLRRARLDDARRARAGSSRCRIRTRWRASAQAAPCATGEARRDGAGQLDPARAAQASIARRR